MFSSSQPIDINRLIAIHFAPQNGCVALLHGHNTRWGREVWRRCREDDWVAMAKTKYFASCFTYNWLSVESLFRCRCQCHCELDTNRILRDLLSHAATTTIHLPTVWWTVSRESLHNRPIYFLQRKCRKIAHSTIRYAFAWQPMRMLGKYVSLPVAFFQTIAGIGTPCAWQCNVTCLFRSTLTSAGSTIQRGGTICQSFSNLFSHVNKYILWERKFLLRK